MPTAEYQQTLDELTGLLDLEPLLEWPVRDLSPGERMKCEIAVALLHRPQVLFLDEPTIGLDVTRQRRIRSFVAEYSRVHDTMAAQRGRGAGRRDAVRADAAGRRRDHLQLPPGHGGDVVLVWAYRELPDDLQRSI